MTIEEFNILSHDEKLFIVVDKGAFLDNYVTKDIRINCYSVDRFFVELVYNSEENRISEIRTFIEGKELDKYSFEKFIN